MDVRVINEMVQQQSAFVDNLTAEVGKVIVGQKAMVERILIGLLAGGHVLLEGVPGLAKTLTVKTLADSLDMRFQRIQFTPDLLPADIVGTVIYNQNRGEFVSKKGPIFANLVLADDHLADLGHDLVDEAALLSDQLVDCLHIERCLHVRSSSASSYHAVSVGYNRPVGGCIPGPVRSRRGP